MKKYVFVLLGVFLSTAFTQVVNQPATRVFTLKEIADNFIRIYPNNITYTGEFPSWTYEQGLMAEAFYQTWKRTGDIKYYNYVKAHYDYFINSSGAISTYSASGYRLDDICPGKTLVRMYNETSTAKYKTAATKLRDQLRTQPRTSEGGFWHKQIYPYQMWLDGLYMAEPFYTLYAVTFNDTAAFDDIANQFMLINKHLYDSTAHIYYHGWDEQKAQAWANPVTGTSASFWGRAIGWFMMGLVDVLDHFPQNHPKRAKMVSMLNELCSGIRNYRDPVKKLWYQVVDKPTTQGNYLEASSSLMYIYVMLKSARLGYISSDFKPFAREAYAAVFDSLVTTDANNYIYLNQVCKSAGLGGTPYRDGSFAYYISEPRRTNDFKGYGAFILTAIENELAATDVEAAGRIETFTLSQNYPNPFNPATRIQYSLPVESKIVLTVTDALGNEIATLVQGNQKPGNYEIEFNPNQYDLPSGVYLYTFRTDQLAMTKKMMYLK